DDAERPPVEWQVTTTREGARQERQDADDRNLKTSHGYCPYRRSVSVVDSVDTASMRPSSTSTARTLRPLSYSAEIHLLCAEPRTERLSSLLSQREHRLDVHALAGARTCRKPSVVYIDLESAQALPQNSGRCRTIVSVHGG